MEEKKSISTGLKAFFVIAILGALLVTLIGGYFVVEQAPPYPGKVVTSQGKEITTRDEIIVGQSVFQEYGLMDVGSVWGHGTYRGPDFTAETLHLIGVYSREFISQQRFGKEYDELILEYKKIVDTLAIAEIKNNTYDASKDTLLLSDSLLYSLDKIMEYYKSFFTEGKEQVPILPGTIKDEKKLEALSKFFFWTAWAAGTLRPDKDHTYTNNWPPDRSVGNDLSKDAFIWTMISIIAFLGFLGFIVFVFHWFGFFARDPHNYKIASKYIEMPISPSQRKTGKYFLVVSTLFLLQTLMGGFLANSTVSPNNFYGISLISDFIPYNWAKTWHLQLAVFWIATAWIGSSLYSAPLIGGKEPKMQGLLVDLLFVAVIVVALGSLTGEVIGLKGGAGSLWFWLGHQGWEYLELGRLWQVLLWVGLFAWLFIVIRAMTHHFKGGESRWGLPSFYAYSAVAVVIFYGFGLLYTNKTHLTVADFWRWWVVHTWVEGMFEFFAAAAIAYVTVNLGLADEKGALRAAYFTAGLAVSTGIIGVGHHYFWFGDPSIWLALGGVISAMEPVPILLLLAKVWQEHKAVRNAGKEFPYKWPLYFLTASAVWAFVGAGLFGFLITLPAINYYEHSTYLTVNHGHTALFGTYGMLAIGLMLFALRGIVKKEAWDDRILKLSFGGLNIGLILMFLFTLLPVGILQLRESFTNGLWYARSPAFYSRNVIQWFGQIRMFPDTIIIVLGVLPLLYFVGKGFLNLKEAKVKDGEDIKY